MDEADQSNCRFSTNTDSCKISFSLTNIPLLFLSDLISPFSFINPSCRVTVERVQPTSRAMCEWLNSNGSV